MKHAKKGKKHDKREAPEDLTQTSDVNDNGSAVVTLSATGHDGEEHNHFFTIGDGEDGSIEIISNHGEDTGSKTVTISEDVDDGGIDLDIVHVNAEGESHSRHIEMDMNDDGSVALEITFERDGEQHTHSLDLDIVKLLGEEGEALTVSEVMESYLECRHIELSTVDLTGVTNYDASVDGLVV